MFIIHMIDLSTINKMYKWVFMFSQNQKYRLLEKEKVLQLYHFRNCVFTENAQFFVRAFL